ncbi:MAG: EipB family protein [Rhizomicrobium sp.]|jgi:hypothetical protein
MILRWTCGAAAILAIVLAGNAAGKDKSPALSTREIYEISLSRTSGYLLTAHGRTVIEAHSGCGGTHTVQRSLSDTTYKDGRPIRTDFIIDTRESADGRTLNFHVRNTQSGNGMEVHDGAARLDSSGAGRVTFTSKERPLVLPRGTVFPAAFARAMLEAAFRGHDLQNHTVFQGGGRDALVTAAVRIGSPVSRPRELARDPAGLLKGRVWPILISYFPERGELPASEVAAHLYANGVLGSLSLVYQQFTLRVKLVRVERLRSGC